MANDSHKHNFLGKRYLKKLKATEAAWLASKASDTPRNAELAHELRKTRAIYRDKYRPLPVDGVSIGRQT